MKKDKVKIIKDLSRRLMPLKDMAEKVVENKKKKYVRSNEKAKVKKELERWGSICG